MNSKEFIIGLEDAYREELTDEQKSIMMARLGRFSEKELQRIFNWLLEHHSPSQGQYKMPFIGDVYDAARVLGVLKTETPGTVEHIWKKSNCDLCEGEGRIAVFFESFPARGIDFTQEPVKILPLHKAGRFERSDCSYVLYRCNCDSGSSATLPQGWPVWKKEDEVPF